MVAWADPFFSGGDREVQNSDARKVAKAAMKTLKLLFLSIFLSAMLGGCDDKGFSMKYAKSMFGQEGKSERGRAHLNPHPTAGYRIRLKIDNAPGPFEIVRLAGQYDVRNEAECGRIHPMTGTAGRITSMEGVAVTRLSDTEYEGVIHLDKMLDEDYYGRGVCHWELTSAAASVVAGDVDRDRNFVVSLDVKDLIEGGATTRYYPYRAYEQSEMGSATHIGSAAPEDYVPGIRSALFSLKLTSLGEAK